MKQIAAFGVLGILAGCSAAPEAGQNGTCSLDCSAPVIPPSNITIKQLKPPEDTTIFCANNSAEPQALGVPITIRFKAFRTIGTVGEGGDEEGEADAAGGDAAGGALLQGLDGTNIPVSGVGFEPWVEGGLSIEKTNDEFKDETGTSATPAKFLGVGTASAEWCSDSCGIMTYEVWPVCFRGVAHDVTAGVLAGGVEVEKFYKYTVSEASAGATTGLQ